MNMVRTTPSRAAKAKDSQDEATSSAKPAAKSPPKKGKAVWTPAEDESLMRAVEEDRKKRGVEGDDDEEEDWDEIAKSVQGKSAVQCFRRYSGVLSKEGAAPPAAAAGTTRTRDERDEEESESSSPASKKSKPDPDEDYWPDHEIELLKKLVEHYNDSKCFVCSS